MPPAGRNAERSCIGCRKVLSQGELVRYVVAPDGSIVVDYHQRLPGRGAYTCLDTGCIANAVKRGQFARTFHRPVPPLVADELVGALVRQLREQILGLLGLARKAGQTVSGSNLVLMTLGGEYLPALVLMATDTSPGIAAKVAGKAAAVGVPLWRCFDKELLGQILGKEERSVVAVKVHPLAESLATELFRFTHIAGES